MNATINIPAGWKKSELGDLLGERKKKVTPTAGDDRAYVALEHMATDAVALLGHDRAGSATSAKTIFTEGDLLFGKLRPNLRKCVMAPFDGVCSTDILALHAKNGAVPSFLLSLLHSARVMGFAKRTAIGTKMPRTSWEQLSQCAVLVPPKPEQIWIAEMFDAVDAAIDATRGVIEQTRRLKTAVLQDLLTRGLPGRHSEFVQHRWFSRLPRDWQLQRVEDIATRVTDGEHNTPPRSASGVYLLSARNVLDGQLALDDVDYVTEDTYRALCRRIQPEHRDLLISCSGTVGRVCLVPRDTPMAMVRSVAIVKLDQSKMLPEFAHWAMRSQAVQRQIKVATSVLAQGNLFQEQIKALVLPVPGRDEQQQIANTMSAVDDRESNEVSKLRALALLKTALSQALLTGRVRVPVAKGVPVAS